MNFGISTACFYPLETEKSLERVNNCGCNYTELFVNAFSEFNDEYLNRFKKIKEENSTKIISVHPFTSLLETQFIFGDYPRRFEEGLELYKHIFSFTAELGAKISVLHGAKKEYPITCEEYTERYARLYELAKQNGVMLAQECVDRCKSSSPAFLAEMRRLFPEAKFVLDLKQTRRAFTNYKEYIDAMGSNIVHLHLSDGVGCDNKKPCLPIGDGDFDFRQFFRELDEVGFKGDAILELYSNNFKTDDELISSIKLLESFIES